MDLNTLYHRTVETWVDRVNAVPADAWDRPTPCREWSVRALVNHVTGEDLWTSPLMEGSSPEEVGDRYDGDLLGDDPSAPHSRPAMAAITTVAQRLPELETVHLSYGEERAAEYVHQLAADHLVHAWDLAVATSGDLVWTRTWSHEVADLVRRASAGLPRGRGGRRPGGRRRRRPGEVAGRLRTRPAVGRQPRDARAVLGRLRPGGRGGDHGPDDRRLLLRGDGPGAGRSTTRGGRSRASSLGGALRGHRPTRLHGGGDVRLRRPGRAALAVRLARRRRHRGTRPRRRRGEVPRRTGRREAVLRQGLSVRDHRRPNTRAV